VAAQLGEVVLDVGQGDLALPGVEQVEGNQLDGLDHARGVEL